MTHDPEAELAAGLAALGMDPKDAAEYAANSTRRSLRAGTVDEAPALAMNQKASIVADAAIFARMKLEQASGRRGDLTTLARLVNVEMPALAAFYDAIIGGGKPASSQ